MQLVVNENGWNNFSTQTKVEMPVYGNCVYVCGCAYVWISLISKLMMMPMSNLSELNADKIRWIEINEMLLFSHGRWNSVVYRPIVQFVSIETRFGDTIVSFVYDFYELASRGGSLCTQYWCVICFNDLQMRITCYLTVLFLFYCKKKSGLLCVDVAGVAVILGLIIRIRIDYA